MNFFKTHTVFFNVFSRVLVALLGGYLLSNLAAILIPTLPNDNKINSIVAGLMSSFVVYAIAVIFVFSTQTVLRAFLVISSVCIVAFSLITYFSLVAQA